MKNIIYQIGDSSQNVPEGDDNWISGLLQTRTMCICKNLLIRKPIDIYLNEKIKKSFAPITYARGTSILMMRKDVVDIIGSNFIIDTFYIGKVYDKDQKLSEEYISLVSQKEEAYIRGEHESTCRICSECGSLLYFPLPLNSWYLLKKDVQNNNVFSSKLYSIIVSETIYKKISESKIKKIGVDKIPIIERALDGYDDLFNLLN